MGSGQCQASGCQDVTAPGRAKRTPVWIYGLAALGMSGAVPAVASAQQPAKTLVFDEVNVIDVEQGKIVPAQRVVITGNRITAMGSASAAKVPKDAQIVDARGKYLIPGLWDMHVHPDPPEDFGIFHSLLIANGVTGIRIPYLATASIEDQVQWRKEVVAGTRVGPRQLLAGRTLNSFEDSWGTDPDSVRRGMDSLRALGMDFFKVYPLDSSTLYLATAARKLGVLFGGHVTGISAIEASDSGISIIDHINSSGDLDERCLRPDRSVEQCRLAAEAFKRNGTAWSPTLTVHDRHDMFPDLLALSLPIYQRLTEVANRFWQDSFPLVHGNWLRDSSKVATQNPSNSTVAPDTLGLMAIVQRVGLPVVASTDTGPGEVEPMPPGFSLHTELAMYVREGLTTLNALQSATINVAKILRATDSLGTVATGKLADLVLLDANPLEDITNTTTVRAVVANGRYFDRAALDSLLTDVRAKK